MPNLRALFDNAADRATLTASTEAPNLPAANLKTNLKGQVWRSTASSATLTLTWPIAESLRCVALPFSNLTSTATIRVQGYALPTDTITNLDTGTKLAAPYQPLGLWDWGNIPLGVNAYAYGGHAYGVIYFPIVNVRKIVITITDTNTVQGYIEAGRLVAGNYWEAQRNADWGAAWQMDDRSRHERTHGGDLMTEIGARNRKLSFTLGSMSEGDRAQFVAYMAGFGMAAPIFLSIFPEASDPTLEQTFMLFGKLSQTSQMQAQYFDLYAAPIEIEEI